MAEKAAGQKLLWIMIILVLLSSAGAAAAIYMVMDQRDDGSEDAEMQQAMERQTPILCRLNLLPSILPMTAMAHAYSIQA